MNRILSKFVHQFSFESLEMKSSYFLFNKEVEIKLLTLLQIIATVSMAVFTISGLTANVSYGHILIRVGLVFASFVLFIIRQMKWLTLYKLMMIAFGGSNTLYMVIHIFKLVAEATRSQILLVGNAVGMFEIIFVLSFKTVRARLSILMMLCIFKMSCLYDEIINQPRPYIQFLIFVTQVFFFCLYHDILDRRIFGLMYKASEKIKKFQDLLSNDLPSSVMIMSSNFNSILYSNKFFQQKFVPDGRNQVTGKMINDLFGKLMLQEEHREEKDISQTSSTSVLEYLMKIASNSLDSQEMSQGQIRILYASHKDEKGNELHYEVRLREIFWDSKHSYAVVMNDITDKHIVTALKIADEQKDRVIATVSHELRTPINGIIGLLEMASELSSNKSLLGYLDNCKNCSKLLLYLVNAILDLSQLRNNSLKIIKNYFSATEMLEELKSLYKFQSHHKDILFIIEKDPTIEEEIYTDKFRLLEILINLLGNAFKFTFKGSVKLRVSKSEQRENALVFCIEDTGLGIMEEDKGKLFKMFGKIEQTNKNINTHGVGLGLTIANELVKALNENHNDEKIMFESEYNKGSKFWFTLDVDNPTETSSLFLNKQFEGIISGDIYSIDRAEYLEPCPPFKRLAQLKFRECLHSETNPFLTLSKEGDDFLTSPKSIDSNSKRYVLLVDDNPINLMAAGFILEKLGFSIIKALNGQEGIKLLEENMKTGKYPSLVVTDIQMPIMDGLEMSRRIKDKIQKQEIYPLPVVALTAKKIDQKELEKYRECGIAWALEKPLIKSEIEKIIAGLMV